MSTDDSLSVPAGAFSAESLGGASGFPFPEPLASSVTRHVEAMVDAWRRGERTGAEDILARHPELDDDAAIRLIFEEYNLSRDAGLDVSPSDIARRFPRWGAELALLLDCQRLLDSAPARVEFPRVGEVVAGFRLLAELGRGAAGRVYLAAQPSLGDRRVVVKITAGDRGEHLSLARLQHMNIVPLYSEHRLRDRNLQVLCMPFLGGATLAQVLEALEPVPVPVAERTGAQIVAAIDRAGARRNCGLPPDGPFRRYIARAGYVEAIVSIGAALADGLHYAHERDLVHMDVKPSNVLLAGDGQPMLLDFHLARSPIRPESPPPAWMGGTLKFMAPEHRRAMEAVRARRPIREPVDGRADVYSLGMLLYHALGGPMPEAEAEAGSESAPAPEPGHEAQPPLERCNPRVSPGLSDIIHKCLCTDPARRYPDAASLAGDLRRHLADLPLAGVSNRSWRERWNKWRRRHPGALGRRAVVVLVLFGGLAAPAASLGIAYFHRVDAAAAALAQGRELLARHEEAAAASVLQGGLTAVGRFPGLDGPRRELIAALERARRGLRLAELHALAETIRFRYGLAPPPADEAPSLIRLGRRTWVARGALLRDDEGSGAGKSGGAAGSRLDPVLRTDLLDLVVLWADLRVRYAAPGDFGAARREAVAVLTEAAAILGPSPALERDRRAYALALGTEPGPTGAAEPAPRTAWEFYDLGRAELRAGHPERAAEHFRRGLKLRPQDFWLNFYDGLCGYRLGRFDDAVEAFRVCIALAPDSAECFHNRALAYQAQDALELALADYDRALELSPDLPDARLNRGIVAFRLGRLDAALADLERAARTAKSQKTLELARENLALVRRARDDRQPRPPARRPDRPGA